MTEKKCGNCRFAHYTGIKAENWMLYECRRRAPMFCEEMPSGTRFAVFPQVTTPMWCGEWEKSINIKGGGD